MKFNINQPLLDLDDKTPVTAPPIPPETEGKALTLADVIIRSLKGAPADPNESADHKYETYKLARRCQQANDGNGILEVSQPECSRITTAVAKNFLGAVPYGRIRDLFEHPIPEDPAKPDKPTKPAKPN